MNANIRDNLNAALPVGMHLYVHQAATRVETTINGVYLEENGFAVSRTTYATLFAKIGTVYGAGNGSTTFNLADFAGRAPVGLAGTGGHADVTALGSTEGVALASRRPKHGTSGTGGTTAGAGAGVASSTTTGTSLSGLGVTIAPIDTGAYLVAGIWAMKYV